MSHLSRFVIIIGLAISSVHAQTTSASPVDGTAAPTGKKPNYFTSKDPAPGGAPNLVWANSNTKRYHCPGTKYYGRTYQGSYVDETEAIEDGYRPSNRTGCSK